MALVLVVLVALFGSATTQKPLPLSSIVYPTAPLLPIAPLADYGSFFQRSGAPSTTLTQISKPRSSSPTIRNYGSSATHQSTSSRDKYETRGDPCNPSPCGPNTRCDISPRKFAPVCRCIDNYIPDGHTINGCLKPECLSHSECPRGSRCDPDRNKCEEVCSLNTCGLNADCEVDSAYRPQCRCRRGYEGNPHIGCKIVRVEAVTQYNPPDPCTPNPCGQNALCRGDGNRAVCECLLRYEGDPISGCSRVECTRSDDCYRPTDACESNKCVHPCQKPGVCGQNTDCTVRNRRAICSCRKNYRGDPFRGCYYEPAHPEVKNPVAQYDPVDYCYPNPCGPNARCRSDGIRAVCECSSGYEGDPIRGCVRVECTRHDDCYRSTDVCQGNKCINPCQIPEICGRNTECEVRNRQPVCSCQKNHVGDALKGCYYDPEAVCKPSPCGRNTNCKAGTDRAVCTCIENHYGDPLTFCEPQCVRDSDCSAREICQNSGCVNLCTHCGEGADCEVRDGRGICTCPQYYKGDPLTRCYPECVTNSECGYGRVCSHFRCEDPCKDSCGTYAECRVENYKPICSCPKDRTGDPFITCRKFTDADLCEPNPCGVDADCTPGFDNYGQKRPVCTCPIGYLGDPLKYCQRGQCIDDRDCPSNKACYQHSCQSTCTVNGKSVCGVNADCRMNNHQPTCSCPHGYRGDPLHYCSSHASLRYTIGRSRKLW